MDEKLDGKLSSSPRTIEFLIPSIVPAQWFDYAGRIWNDAVFYLRWLQHYRRVVQCNAIDLPPIEIKLRKHEWIDKTGKPQFDWVLYCDRTRQFRIDKTKSWDRNNIQELPAGLDSPTWWVTHCPPKTVNPKWLTEPPIADDSTFSLVKPFAQKRCQWLKESGIPQVLVNDFISLVTIPAWEAYKSGLRGKPKYKKLDQISDRIDTLASKSFRGQCHFKGGDKLQLPGLGTIEVYGLEYRLIKPIERMIEGMVAHPDRYPRLQEKLAELRLEARSKLIKADGRSVKELKKELTEEQFIELMSEYDRRIDESDESDVMQRAIDYFSKPGTFRLIRREGKQYIQISGEMPTTITESAQSIGVDTGLDLLLHTSKGLKIEHQDFSDEIARVDRLKSKRSSMTRGSNNYNKITAKIRKIEGKMKRSKRAFQMRWAAELADQYGSIAVKQIKVKEAIEVPKPIYSDKTGGYIPNGRSDSKLQNRELHELAIGQFVALVEQQCKKRGRNFTKVTIEPEATAKEVLEVSGLSDSISESVSVTSTEAQSPSSQMNERCTGSRKAKEGMGKTDSPDRLTSQKARKPKVQAPEFVSLANPPEDRKRERRNRKREKAIG